MAANQDPSGKEKMLSMDEVFLQRIEEAIESNIEDKNFGVDELGREIGMSRSQIHRKLQALTGKSASRYIRTYKLEKARHLLANNTGTVAEISWQLGFSSPAYFGQVFTEEYGYPPSEARTRTPDYSPETPAVRSVSAGKQLSAVMFTDISGYSAIMGENREEALRLLERNKALQKPLFEKFEGKFIKEMGDGLIATFPNASEAIHCALEIQRESMKDSSLTIKIAIHVGEVTFSNDDVYGDAVNVASRIERIVQPGQIYISESVHEVVDNITEIHTSYLGRIKFKNIRSRIAIYSIATDFLEPASKTWFRTRRDEVHADRRRPLLIAAGMILTTAIVITLYFLIPGSPPNRTVAVIPFENVDEGEFNDYFTIGITEEIGINLSRIGALTVVDANLRSYDYKEKSFTRIARDLKVSNLLVLGIRKFEDRVRVTARLIELPSGEQIWADQYNKKMDDIFTIQSEIAASIAQRLEAEISDNEEQQISAIPTKNPEAYDLYLKGRDYYFRRSPNDLMNAIDYYHRALKLDPDFALPYAGLSDAFSQLATRVRQPEEFLDSAVYYANIAITKSPELSNGYKSLGLYYTTRGSMEQAVEEYNKAIDIDGNVEAAINLSRIQLRMGNIPGALDVLNDVSKNTPLNHELWFNYASLNYQLNNLDIALQYLNKALEINPNHLNSLLLKWVIASLQDNEEMVMQISGKLGFIGEDESGIIFTVISDVLNERLENPGLVAETLSGLIQEKEMDYVELPYVYSLIAYVYYSGGLSLKAEGLLDLKKSNNLKMIQAGNHSYKNYYEIAQIEGVRGNKEKAIEWLEKAKNNGWTEYVYAQADPMLRSLANDQIFQEIIDDSRKRADSLNLMNTTIELK